MIMSLYSIYYRKSKWFGPLWEAKTHGEAVDKFRHVIDGMSVEGAEACELHYLADFDDSDGTIRREGRFDTFRASKVDAPEADITLAPKTDEPSISLKTPERLEAERARAMYALAMKVIDNEASRLKACLETIQDTLNKLRNYAGD